MKRSKNAEDCQIFIEKDLGIKKAAKKLAAKFFLVDKIDFLFPESNATENKTVVKYYFKKLYLIKQLMFNVIYNYLRSSTKFCTKCAKIIPRCAARADTYRYILKNFKPS